jgi:predicted nucleotidyltransferase
MNQPSAPDSKTLHESRDRLLEQRHQEAWAIAHECERVLQEQFGATQVIVFGSLIGQSPWHLDSDLDIAVAGLTDELWLKAYGCLETLAPSWLKIDLVRLERATPEVRVHILQEKCMPSNRYLALKERLEEELIALEKTTAGLVTALERSQTIPEDFVVRTLASYINDFYKRCERMSEQVAVTLDGGLPEGVNWHQALLRQMADAGQGGRPPLWSGSLLLDLDNYRKFRHVVHHKYGNELKSDYVVPLAEMAPSILPSIRQAIATFGEWLLQQADIQS